VSTFLHLCFRVEQLRNRPKNHSAVAFSIFVGSPSDCGAP
jgi:hypothetical protein